MSYPKSAGRSRQTDWENWSSATHAKRPRGASAQRSRTPSRRRLGHHSEAVDDRLADSAAHPQIQNGVAPARIGLVPTTDSGFLAS
jgi:hypothetical protein